MYSLTQVISFINSFSDYDIRKTKDARYVDQKCTPDFVCLISDCILSTSCNNKTFTVNDLWEENYFCSAIMSIFSKPNPNSPDEKNEINKVLSQPLKLLAYAHVLNVQKQNKVLYFSVNNVDVLEFIAARELNAFNFLYEFFMKVISDSGIKRFFDEYSIDSKNDAKSAKEKIYDKYHRFISANTPSKSKLDVTRMFHKVFNIYAFKNSLPGSSNKILLWHDLMYNKENWRDINKSKNQSRAAQVQSNKNINLQYFIKYHVDKAMNMVRKYHKGISEVNDNFKGGKATEAHHIFPRSKFPELAAYLENLIMLTPTQHTVCAHPNGNTQLVDLEYQYSCIMSKSFSVQESVKIGDDFYSLQKFIEVVNTGYKNDVIDSSENNFDEVRRSITTYFHSPCSIAAEDEIPYGATRK